MGTGVSQGQINRTLLQEAGRMASLVKEMQVQLAAQGAFLRALQAELRASRPSEVPLALPPRPTLAAVIEDVAAHHGLAVSDLTGASQKARPTAARHHAMAVARHCGYGVAEIARAMGGRDHSTVSDGVRAHERRLRAAGGGLP